MTSVRIELSADALEALQRPVNRQGGFQSLLRAVQQQFGEANILILTPALVERVARYMEQYGEGGFHGRLEYILMERRALARALRPLA